MKINFIYLFVFLILFRISLKANVLRTDTITLLEWNVENLFDCRHDTLKNDIEFLPTSIRHWTYYRYRHKLDQIAKTIIAAGEWNPPTLVALCEVENDSVLVALTRYSALAEQGYRYVMTHSPDQRGINVALLYQRDHFKLIESKSIKIEPFNHYKPTRDILHVTGLVTLKDTLDIFIVHAPSRAGGVLETQPYRMKCMEILKGHVDSVMLNRQKPNVIVTGDFNDFPDSPSIRKILQVKIPGPDNSDMTLYHLLAQKVKKDKTGTYKYKGEWNLLDHLIVNSNLIDPKNSIYTNEQMTEIIRLPFLMTDDTTYNGYRPLRTYYGMKYEGGYSDHLPLRLKLIIQN